MPELHAPWLEIAIFVPLITAILIGLVPNLVWRWMISSVVAGLVAAQRAACMDADLGGGVAHAGSSLLSPIT